jgi:hypothetical protein
MGNDEGTPFRLTSPNGETVADTRPEFRWQPLAGAARYQITIVEDDTQREALSAQATAQGEKSQVKWRFPTDRTALTPGKTFRWFVAAILPDDRKIESPSASGAIVKFRVIDSETRRKLDVARQETGGSHLIMGLLYRRAGLLNDARREFDLLSKANPKESLPKQLILQIDQLRHRP